MTDYCRTVYHLILLLPLLLLVACAGKPPTITPHNDWLQTQLQISNIEQWKVKGRIGIKTAEQNNASNFSWQHLPEKQFLTLYGSLGMTYAELSQTEGIARLELSDKEVYESDDVESLLQQVLGYPLPVEHLKYWIFGQPYPGDGSDLTFDESGYLKTIHYQQWAISYKNYKTYQGFNDIYLPGKIKVTDGNVTLRLFVRSWSKESGL